jgi:hypothetical protein
VNISAWLYKLFLKICPTALSAMRVAKLAEYAKTGPDGEAKNLIIVRLPELRANLTELMSGSFNIEGFRRLSVKLTALEQQIKTLKRGGA